MGRQLSTGDVIVARIAIFDRTRDPILTIQDKDLGKIPTGELLKISPTRVPRLIGKRGSMIQTIEQASSTRITIGQNGIIVVSGNDKEGVALAINAIHIVEVEAHTSNLTQRIKQLLNVPESEIEGDDDSQTTNEVNEAASSDEKSISNDINSEMGVVNPNGSK
jgi:exosome complex component RRP4